MAGGGGLWTESGGSSWAGQLAWALVTTDLESRTDHPHGAPIRRLSPELSLSETQPQAPRFWPLSPLVPGGPLSEGLLPKDPAPEGDASNLTHGN